MVQDPDYPLKIKHLLKSNPRGMTISALSKKLKINRNSMGKYLEILLSSGQVDRMEHGPSKVYFLSQRVPVSSLMNFSSEMVIILDAKKRIVQVNDRFLQCLKEKREFLVGQGFADISIPLVHTLAGLRILKEPSMEKEASTELSFLISGKKIYFKIKTLPIIFEDGGHGLTIIIENITQQKQYENDLIQNEARYRAIVEDQTELIYRRLPDGTITFVNGAFARYFCKTPEELLGMNIHSLIPSLEQDRVMRRNTLDNRLMHNDTYEQRVALDNGAIQWLQWSDNELHDKTGALTEIQSVGKDITLQKDREKEIIVNGSIAASSGYALVITDIMGRVVFANRAFISVISYEDEHEVAGEPLEKFVRRTGIQDNISQITAGMIQSGEWSGTATARKKDGTEFEIEVYASMIADEQHFPCNMIALFSKADPSTGRKKPVQSPNDSGQPDKKGIAVIDAHGTMIYVNRDLLDMTGYPEEEGLLGRSITVLIGNDSIRTAGFDHFIDSLAGGDHWSGEGMVKHNNGSSLPIQLSATRVRDAQGIFHSAQITFISGPERVSDTTVPQELHEKIRKLIEFIPFPTYVIDREKKVVTWNRALELMTSVKQQDIIGTDRYKQAFSFYKGARPVLVDLLDLPVKEAARQYPHLRRYGDCIFFEGFIPLSDGIHEAYLWGKASPLFDPQGNRIGAIESVQDISDWKKIQVSLNRMRDEINDTFEKKIQQLRKKMEHSDISGS
jgi:PAS domain S-box-containing protein